MPKVKYAENLIERKCPVCGKVFIIHGSEWGWKCDGKYACSYPCVKVLDANKEEKSQRRYKKRGKDRNTASAGDKEKQSSDS